MFGITAVFSMTAQDIAFVLSKETAKRIKPETLQAVVKKNFGKEVKMLQPEAQENLESLKKYRIIFSDADLLSAKGFNALEEYVKNGGYLVGLASFARWLDVNDNDALDRGVDGQAQKESEKLTGCVIQSNNLSIVKIRNLSPNPILRNFYVNKWIPYPLYKPSASSLKISGEAIPIAEAQFRPFGYKKEGFKHDYWSTRYRARYDSYITAKLLGKGVVVRIAESLYTAPMDKGLFKALMKNLLEEASYRELASRFQSLKTPSILYEYESLAPNPDFEEICSVSSKASKKNASDGVFPMPANWQFNSWNGKYFARLEKGKNEYGKYLLMMGADDPDSRCGGAIWSAHCNQSSLIPGKTYKITVMAKGKNITRGNFGITAMNKKGKTIKYIESLPSGSFDWKEFDLEFSVPITYQGQNALKRGITTRISFTGPGKLYADHFVLKEIQ